MRNQKGVTVVSLIVTVVVMLIIASVTITASLSSYKTMRYQTFMAELEEVQSAVNETSESYLLERSLNSSLSYSDYFTNRYGSSPRLIGSATSEPGVSELVALYAVLTTDSQYIYYFNQDDIRTYFGLEVTLDAVLIDFSTRYVYSVEGCQDPINDEEVYYTLAEMGGETNVYLNETSAESATNGLVASDDNSNTLYTSRKYKTFKSNINT